MAEENRTKTQMEQELQQLRKVFSAARLLEAEAVQGKTPVDGQSCFAQWGRMDACENCAAQKALQEGRQVSKLESGGGELYRITASPVTVEGRRCVLELAQKLDPEEGRLLLDRFASQREQDYRDPLTGASTRRYYADTYQGKNLTAGVARIELDDFKLFTDVYGHYAGNSILETAAGVIRRGLEENDHLIRYTDETFLLVTDVPQERFGQKMEQIRLQLAAASVPGYSHIRLSASIGGIWVRDTDADEAVKRAGRLMRCARTQKNTVTVLSAKIDDPTGYGRIIRDEKGSFVKSVEHKDASEKELGSHEINSGMYLFDTKELCEALGKIKPNNAQGEYYLPDTLAIIREKGLKVDAFALESPEDIEGVNDKEQLAAAEKIIQRRKSCL